MLSIFIAFPDPSKLEDTIQFAIGDKETKKMYAAAFKFRQGMPAIEFAYNMKDIMAQLNLFIDHPELLNANPGYTKEQIQQFMEHS